VWIQTIAWSHCRILQYLTLSYYLDCTMWLRRGRLIGWTLFGFSWRTIEISKRFVLTSEHKIILATNCKALGQPENFNCFLAMFPEGGQTRKHRFLAMFPKGGQTRKHCFLAMFPEGGQTRKHCFLAMFPEGGANHETFFPSHVSRRWTNQETNQETLFPSHVSRRWTNQETLFPSHVSWRWGKPRNILS
jgi:hypothetical protein